MKWLALAFMIPTLVLSFDCTDRRDLTTEKGDKIILCDYSEMQITMKCAQNPKSCKLLQELAQKPDPKKLEEALKITSVGTSGSRLCNLKGWTVLMSEMSDKSQVCTCRHPSGEFISCASLDSYYRD